MTATLTLVRRALLGAVCLLPLAAHSQDASRQTAAAHTPITLALPPPGDCTLLIYANQWNGSYSPLTENGSVCSFNFVYLGGYSDNSMSSTDKPTTWVTYVTVGMTTTAWPAVVKQPGEEYSFQVNQPGYSGADVTYQVYATTLCPNGYYARRTFTFRGIARTAACGQAARQAPSLSLYPSPATDQLAVYLEGGSQAIVLNGSGKEVKRATLHEGKTELSVADLPRGLYLLRVITVNGKVVDKRFSVEH